MALSQLAEDRRRRPVALGLLLVRHRHGLHRDLHLVVDVLRREAERLLEQQQRRDGVSVERCVEKLLADVVELGTVGEHAGPFGAAQRGRDVSRHVNSVDDG